MHCKDTEKQEHKQITIRALTKVYSIKKPLQTCCNGFFHNCILTLK